VFTILPSHPCIQSKTKQAQSSGVGWSSSPPKPQPRLKGGAPGSVVHWRQITPEG